MKFCVCLNISEKDLGLSESERVEAREFKRRFLEASGGKAPQQDCGICYRNVASKLCHVEHH